MNQSDITDRRVGCWKKTLALVSLFVSVSRTMAAQARAQQLIVPMTEICRRAARSKKREFIKRPGRASTIRLSLTARRAPGRVRGTRTFAPKVHSQLTAPLACALPRAAVCCWSSPRHRHLGTGGAGRRARDGHRRHAPRDSAVALKDTEQHRRSLSLITSSCHRRASARSRHRRVDHKLAALVSKKVGETTSI